MNTYSTIFPCLLRSLLNCVFKVPCATKTWGRHRKQQRAFLAEVKDTAVSSLVKPAKPVQEGLGESCPGRTFPGGGRGTQPPVARFPRDPCPLPHYLLCSLQSFPFSQHPQVFTGPRHTSLTSRANFWSCIQCVPATMAPPKRARHSINTCGMNTCGI